MPALLLLLDVGAPVVLIGLFLLVFASSSKAVTKPHVEAGGLYGVLQTIIGFAEHPLSSGLNIAIRLFEAIANFVVSRFAVSYLKSVTRWFTGVNILVRAYTQDQTQLAQATASAIERLRGVIIPEAVGKSAAPVKAQAKAASRAAAHANAHAGQVGHSLDRYKAISNPALRHATHAVDVTLPRDIARVRSREEALSRDQAKLRERTTSLENGATKTWEWIRTHPLTGVTAAFAGAVAIALSRLGLGNLRCSNFTNMLGKWGCGLGTLLDRLLGLAVFLTIAFDFKAFVQAAQFVASGIGQSVAAIEGVFQLSLPPLPPPNR